MSRLDALILSTEAEIEEAKSRLKILKELRDEKNSKAWVYSEEAARQLGISVRTIPVWCMEGKLEGKHPGRRWLVSQASIDKYLGGLNR